MAGNIVRQIDDWVRPQNVLISVSDKRDLAVLVNGLISINESLRIFSTGGTYKKIAEILGSKGVSKHLTRVSDYTGQPETQGGLVKTLDFKIYLGILTETYNPDHIADRERTGALALDMVVVNLYPFEETIRKEGVTVEQARANIDIGGPCMVRASAKNYLRVAAVTDPADYHKIINKMRAAGGRMDLATRFELAQKAFAHTARYDKHISEFLGSQTFSQVDACYEKKGV